VEAFLPKSLRESRFLDLVSAYDFWGIEWWPESCTAPCRRTAGYLCDARSGQEMPGARLFEGLRPSGTAIVRAVDAAVGWGKTGDENGEDAGGEGL